MDISKMSEEEQLQAAMALSMQDTGGAASRAAAPPPARAAPMERGGPRTYPGKDAQDLLPPCPPRVSSSKKPRADSSKVPGAGGAEVSLSEPEVLDLLRLVFLGAGAREDERPAALDIERWLDTGFHFSLLKGTEWGLWQRHGGPCGVFAAVQAFIVKCLLFGEAMDGEASASRVQPMECGPGEEDARSAVLAYALCTVMYQAAPTSSYVVCEVRSLDSGDSAEAVPPAVTAAAIQTGSGGVTVRCRRVTRAAEAQQILEEAADSWLAGPFGALSFVCSVLLSRGLSNVREDMDDPAMPLLGRFGHCSQELVNLMLVGEATSNVFDGTRFLGDDPSSGLLLKGINGEKVGVPSIGFLSGFEAETIRKLEVGTLLKYPDCPIWVIGSATHYTIVFSSRRSDAHLSQEASVEQKAKKAFNENAFDEGGLSMATSLPAMLKALGISDDRLPQAKTELVHEEVVLWSDFRRWALRQFGCSDSAGSGQAAFSKLKLYLYDGQDPPGPSVRSISLEVTDIDPRLAGGGSEGDDLAATLHTRWPNAVVQVAPLAGSGAEAFGTTSS